LFHHYRKITPPPKGGGVKQIFLFNALQQQFLGPPKRWRADGIFYRPVKKSNIFLRQFFEDGFLVRVRLGLRLRI